MPLPGLLRDLLLAPAPPGAEEEAARVWREAAAAFAEVTGDTLGTSYARVRAGEGAPTLALVGHIDEIGIAVTHVSEEGYLSFTTVGGISPEALLGQRVRFGDVGGVIARRRVDRRAGQEAPRLELTDLHVDIGARSRDEALGRVRIGDGGVWEGEPVELPNGRLVSKALDNRLGCYVALEAARRIAEAGDAQVDVVAVAAVAEEVGHFGARAAAFSLEPDVAIAIDVTWATDVPGGDARAAGKVDLGAGPTIERGPMINRHVYDLLAAAAKDEGIEHSIEVSTRATHTDTDEFHTSRGGVPSGLVSIPLRYMHTPVELCSLDDVEGAIRLLVAFARRLARDQSYLR
ncbi:MAG: M20/M25/M40 family metallo-hydrolase [Actinobacteria bacterium]|nr:M20/M25/M40 family metallo-hydrolase [Actinomycetota bacterium]